MNIKERIFGLEDSPKSTWNLDIFETDVLDMIEELHRLWKIEECALLCQDINQSPGNTHCHDKLREALAAEGQE